MKHSLNTAAEKTGPQRSVTGKNEKAKHSLALYAGAYLLLAISVLLLSCSKDNSPENGQPDGPDVLQKTSGYLCTGTTAASTYNYWVTSTQGDLTGYKPEWVRPEDKIKFTNNSNGTVSIELMTPFVSMQVPLKYFKLYKAGNPSISEFPNHPYQFRISADPGPETEFIIHRQDDDLSQFTIESALYRGQFLNRANAKSDLRTDKVHIVGGATELLWYFK